MIMTREELNEINRQKNTTEHFTIDGIIKVTDGGYKNRFFNITEIYAKTETMTFIKCVSGDDSTYEYKFDNCCAIQIGKQKGKFESKKHDYD